MEPPCFANHVDLPKIEKKKRELIIVYKNASSDCKKTSGTKASTFLALEKINQIPTRASSFSRLSQEGAKKQMSFPELLFRTPNVKRMG